MKRKYIFLSSLMLVVSSLQAEVTMPGFFSDNMVLQRDIPLKIWGKAAKNEKVTLAFQGKEYTCETGKDGKWQTELPPMAHGGPYKMTVSGKDNTITFDNILIGDVWICSGQSNMEWLLINTDNSEQEINQSTNSNIRLLTIEKEIKFEETDDIPGGTWEICIPETSRYFSAVGYYFGKELEKALNVPVGLINTSWGGTDIQPWTSWEMMQTTEDYKKYTGKTIKQSIGYKPESIEKYLKAMKNEKGLTEKWYDPKTSLKGWNKMYVPKLWDGELADDDGVIWFRTEVFLPESATGKAATLHLSPVDDSDMTYINGEFIGQTWSYNELRHYPVAPGILQSGKNTIVVRVEDTQSYGGIYGNEEDLYLEVEGEKYFLAGEWNYKPSVLTSQYGINTLGANSFAALLYNGMVKPLVGYGIKGVIWYQGENNAYEAGKYRTFFPNLIKDWRSQWGYEFPFFWVQLANYMAVQPEPAESEWAELREAQNMALALPKTGQAVITDIGEANDIHPRNKKDVGYRLALNALNVAYGKPVVSSGPTYQSMQKDRNRIILTFGNADDGLTTREGNKYGYVKGFTIAGPDKKFVWAKAWIEGNKVIVFHENIPDPVAVRYGWSDNPEDNNLVNGAGLLASPFRTDTWPGITKQ